ncbi:MAG: hypothetical protein M5U19_05510, partial [Microthrixaceae bacterium]|nr:hypothetical protein [Microthrixaceae bacterium]
IAHKVNLVTGTQDPNAPGRRWPHTRSVSPRRGRLYVGPHLKRKRGRWSLGSVAVSATAAMSLVPALNLGAEVAVTS